MQGQMSTGFEAMQALRVGVRIYIFGRFSDHTTLHCPRNQMKIPESTEANQSFYYSGDKKTKGAALVF